MPRRFAVSITCSLTVVLGLSAWATWLAGGPVLAAQDAAESPTAAPAANPPPVPNESEQGQPDSPNLGQPNESDPGPPNDPAEKPVVDPAESPVVDPAEEPAEEPAKEPAGAPPSTAAAQSPPKAPPKPGVESERYAQILARWRKNLAEMAILGEEFHTATGPRRIEIREQWNALVERGVALEPLLVDAAVSAYAEAPNADPPLTTFLTGMLKTHVDDAPGNTPSDRYEEADRIGRLLVEHNAVFKETPYWAGIAAFAVGEFDDAEKDFKLAEEQLTKPAGQRKRSSEQQQAMLERIPHFLEQIPYYREQWAREQELRRAEAAADDLPRVLLKTTKGEITLELFENEAPNTVANFISLVEKGFYDGLTFHRVVAGLMAQSGCPQGTGTGGPGYIIRCECDGPNHRRHFRGSLSMAHRGRHTGGSQFFITFMPQRHLDGVHTVFGRVIGGIEVLAKLQRRDPQDIGAPEPDRIEEAKVIRKRDHEYVPEHYEPRRLGDAS